MGTGKTNGKKFDRHAQLKHAAEMRAALLAYFNREGGEHTSIEIAETLGREVKDVRYYLKSLAASEQLVEAGKRGREYLYSLPGASAGRADDLVQATPEMMSKLRKQVTPREIELVLDGVVIVVGKNPATGRIRVTIDS